MAYIEFERGLSRKARAMQEKAKEFGMQVMRPAGIELDKLKDPADVIAKGSRLWDFFREYREAGLHKMMIPKAYGGEMHKVPPKAMTLVSEQLGYWDSGLAISLGVCGMPFALAILSADAEVRNWARMYTEDKEANLVGCWAITEPDHGSDWILGTTHAGGNPKITPNLKADKKGDEYILNGAKSAWVSNGTIATHAVLHVGLDPSRGMHGSGLAMCPLDLPGITRGPALDKIGQRPLNQGEIFFDDVRLHKKYMLLGVPGIFGANAFGKIFLGTVNSMMGVTFSSLARAVLDETIRFASENEMGGAPMIEQEHVRLAIFNMFKKVEVARLFAHTVAEFPRGGKPSPVAKLITALATSTKATFWGAGKGIQLGLNLYEKYKDNEKVKAFFEKSSKRREGRVGLAEWGKYGIASKVTATDTAFEVASEAIQIFGEKAMSTDYPIEKMFRDARASMIEDGVNESLALAASENLLGLKK